MCVNFNTYHNVKTYKKFYIVNRERLTNKYVECYTEWNNKYSDDYDFYKAVECNGGLNYIAVRKPSYRIYFTDNTFYSFDWNDSIITTDGECMINDLSIGNTIILYDGTQKIIQKIEEY
jgi:hypothetical protein